MLKKASRLSPPILRRASNCWPWHLTVVSRLPAAPRLQLCFVKNTTHLHIDGTYVQRAAQKCTHAHAASDAPSPAVSISAVTVSEYPRSRSINLSLCDSNYVHLFSHSRHADARRGRRSDARLQASGLARWKRRRALWSRHSRHIVK